MDINTEKFADFMSGIQSAVVIFALIVGGGWAIYVYKSGLETERAQRELTILNRQLFEQATLVLQLTHEIIRKEDSQTIFVSVEVVMTNEGNRAATLELPAPALVLNRVSIKDSGNITFQKAGTANYYLTSAGSGANPTISRLSINPRERVVLPFLIKLDDLGLYYAEFIVRLPAEEIQALIDAGVKESAISVWSISKYLAVE